MLFSSIQKKHWKNLMGESLVLNRKFKLFMIMINVQDIIEAVYRFIIYVNTLLLIIMKIAYF